MSPKEIVTITFTGSLSGGIGVLGACHTLFHAFRLVVARLAGGAGEP
jgi:hypothetical protein